MDRVGMRALDRHVLDVALDVVAGVRQFDDEGRMLLVARRVRIGSRDHQRHVGDAGGRRKPFLAVEDVVLVAVLHRRGLHARGVGAGRLLGHREADALVAVEQRLQEFFLLILRAVGEDRHHRGVVGPLRVHRQRAEHALAELHLHQRVGERAEAHAAIFLRHPRTPQALGAGLFPQRAQHLGERLGVEFLFRGNAFVMHPFADLLADRLGFGRNFEIDRHGISSCWLLLIGLGEWHKPAARQRQRQTKFEAAAAAREGVPAACPISPICFPVIPPNGSTPGRAAFSPASAARGRRCCCCTAFRRPMCSGTASRRNWRTNSR